jgi:hypothetical protein
MVTRAGATPGAASFGRSPDLLTGPKTCCPYSVEPRATELTSKREITLDACRNPILSLLSSDSHGGRSCSWNNRRSSVAALVGRRVGPNSCSEGKVQVHRMDLGRGTSNLQLRLRFVSVEVLVAVVVLLCVRGRLFADGADLRGVVVPGS